MIASKQMDVFGEHDLKQEQDEQDLQSTVSSIYIISQKQEIHILISHIPDPKKELSEISMEICDDVYWTVSNGDVKNVRFSGEQYWDMTQDLKIEK